MKFSGILISLACAAAFAIGLASAPAASAQDAANAQPKPAAPVKRVFGVESKMRDGVKLVSDVWLPAGPGPFPVILVRTPYLRTNADLRWAKTANHFAERGYAYVVQDVRGRGDSEGEFRFFAQEAKDGYDTIEALAKEPWSNGRICMMGTSYMGTVQWLAARERPPHLACIAPTAPAGKFHDEVPSAGGAFMMQWAVSWLNDVSGRISQGPNLAAADMDAIYAHRPLLTMDEAAGRRMPLFREFLQHDTLDDYWRSSVLAPEDYEKIDIPVMTLAGWFDGDQTGTLLYWNRLHARSAPVRDAFLTLGPWTHIQTMLGGAEKIGEMTFGKESIVDLDAAHLAFFDRYLKQSTASLDKPKVRVFVTGTNQWRDYEAWPVPHAKETRLFLASGGKANTSQGDGALVWNRSGEGAGADEYVYDPSNPVPLDAERMFAADRSETQRRQDVLVYTSPPLEKALEVIGPVMVELYAASDAKDTDFTATIEDVGPDGKPLLLGPRPVGIIRARYRGGPEARPQLLTPGKPELFRIDLGSIGHSFQPGHRIRIEISSSAYPMYHPNPNTGNPIATDTEWKTARQRILHDAEHPSALVLSTVFGSE